MEITNFSEYIEHLCRRHVDVRHEANGEKHFLCSTAEMETSLDSVLCYPAVILAQGSYHYDGSDGSYHKSYDYNLLVVDHISDTGDYTDIDNRTKVCERIIDELFAQIVIDKRDRKYSFLASFSIQGIDVDPVKNIDLSLYGYSAPFNIDIPYKGKNCRKAFLEDRSFDETFDKTFN